MFLYKVYRLIMKKYMVFGFVLVYPGNLDS